MTTVVNVDGEILARAAKLTGIRQGAALVRRGLECLIAAESAKRLAALGGSEKGLEAIPRRPIDPPEATDEGDAAAAGGFIGDDHGGGRASCSTIQDPEATAGNGPLADGSGNGR